MAYTDSLGFSHPGADPGAEDRLLRPSGFPDRPATRPDLAVSLLGLTPVGTLRLAATARGLRTISFIDGADPRKPPPLTRAGRDATRALGHLRDATAVLRGYFAGVCMAWDLSLDLEGLSDFQLEVFQALQRIPFGSTRSYGDLAEVFGGPENARAVGRAVGSNPLPIIIPCHRVLRHDGRLGGFSGGLERKATLLQLEGLDVEGTSGSSRVVLGGLRLDL
jgi:O-6-methylguanine DNA methyltransferase